MLQYEVIFLDVEISCSYLIFFTCEMKLASLQFVSIHLLHILIEWKNLFWKPAYALFSLSSPQLAFFDVTRESCHLV